MPQFTTADRIGVIGGYLGAVQSIFGNGGLGNLFSGNANPNGFSSGTITVPAAQVGGGYVTQTEMTLNKEINCKDQVICRKDIEIAQLKAEQMAKNYTDCQIKPLEQRVCALEAALAMEIERRSCGDKDTLCYVNGHFIPGELTLNSREINYHGVEPVLRPDRRDCCRGPWNYPWPWPPVQQPAPSGDTAGV